MKTFILLALGFGLLAWAGCDNPNTPLGKIFKGATPIPTPTPPPTPPRGEWMFKERGNPLEKRPNEP